MAKFFIIKYMISFNFRKILKDPTSATLLLSNLALLAIAIVEKWDFMVILWTYFSQSLIIGFFVFFKIILFGVFIGVEGITASKQNKIEVASIVFLAFFFAIFFVFHYGGFHLVYFMFLQSFTHSSINWGQILIGGGIFFLNHLFSFIVNFKKDRRKITNPAELTKLFISPYQRIIPMHFIILIGGVFFWLGIFPIPMLILFVFLKTAIDIASHQKDHATIMR